MLFMQDILPIHRHFEINECTKKQKKSLYIDTYNVQYLQYVTVKMHA